MPFLKVPVNVAYWSNVEEEARSIVAEERYDVIKDTLGATVRRPCLKEFYDGLPAAADGLYYWDETDLCYVVSNGNLYSIDIDANLTLIGSDLFNLNTPVIWDKSGDFTLVVTGSTKKLFAANGGRIVKYDKTTASKITEGAAPELCTHVVIFDSYGIANERGHVQYEESALLSEVADPDNYDGEFFSAENKSDEVIAVHSEWDEVALFGTESIEPFYNDGSTPITKIPGGNTPDGTRSPYSIKFADNAYFYLNKDRQVVRLDGRQPLPISQPVDDILDIGNDAIAQASRGEIVTLGKKQFYLLTINGQTLVYDIQLREWAGKWATWDKTYARYGAFKGRNIVNIKQWNKTLCTDPDTGKIYELTYDLNQDVGEEVRSSVVTGNIDHGTGREKRSNELRLRLKRGQAARLTIDDVEPVMLVRWNDNGSGIWSNYREVPLGFTGDGEFYYSLFQLGSYRARQYEFVVTDNVPFSIVEVEEDVEFQR